jgi:hypothetical protein
MKQTKTVKAHYNPRLNPVIVIMQGVSLPKAKALLSSDEKYKAG